MYIFQSSIYIYINGFLNDIDTSRGLRAALVSLWRINTETRLYTSLPAVRQDSIFSTDQV